MPLDRYFSTGYIVYERHPEGKIQICAAMSEGLARRIASAMNAEAAGLHAADAEEAKAAETDLRERAVRLAIDGAAGGLPVSELVKDAAKILAFLKGEVSPGNNQGVVGGASTGRMVPRSGDDRFPEHI